MSGGLGQVDVEIVPKVDEALATIDRELSAVKADITVGAQLDKATADTVAAALHAEIGTINADVVPTVDVGAAARVDNLIETQVGDITIPAVAEADVASALVANERLEAAAGPVNVGVNIDDDFARIMASFDGEFAQLRGIQDEYVGIARRIRDIGSDAGGSSDDVDGLAASFGGASSVASDLLTKIEGIPAPLLAAGAAAAALAAPLIAVGGSLGLSTLVTKDFPEVAAALDDIKTQVGGIFDDLGADLAPSVVDFLKELGRAIETLKPAMKPVGELFVTLNEAGTALIKGLVDSGALELVIGGIRILSEELKLIAAPVRFIGEELTILGEIATDVGQFIVDALVAAADTAADFLRTVDSAAFDIVPDGVISDLESFSAGMRIATRDVSDLERKINEFGGLTEQEMANVRNAIANVLADAIIDLRTGIGSAADVVATNVETATQTALTAWQAYHDQVRGIFESGPSFADLVVGGATPEEALAQVDEFINQLNAKTFGLDVLQSMGLDSLANEVAQMDPAQAGEFVRKLLEMPPEDLAKLNTDLDSATRNLATAAFDAAEEQGQTEIVALNDAMALGLLDGKPKYRASGIELGTALADGIVAGIASRSITDAVTEIGDAATGALRKVWGIRSPSTVFAELGGYAVDGLVQGIEGGYGDVDAAIAGMMPGAFDVPSIAQPAVRMPAVMSMAPDLVGARAGGGGVTVQVNAPQVDPYATGREIGRLVEDELHMNGDGPSGVI